MTRRNNTPNLPIHQPIIPAKDSPSNKERLFIHLNYHPNDIICHHLQAIYSVHHCDPIFSTKIGINGIPGKSFHARAFTHERLQHHVSCYVGIDMFSRTILKTMYRTISNRRLTTNRDETQQDSGLGQNRTCLQHNTSLVLSRSCQHPIGDRS